MRHLRHEKTRQHRRAREINRPVFQISHHAPVLFLLHQRIGLKNKIRQQMSQQKRQQRSQHIFHLIPPLARLCATFYFCTCSYNGPHLSCSSVFIPFSVSSTCQKYPLFKFRDTVDTSNRIASAVSRSLRFFLNTAIVSHCFSVTLSSSVSCKA